MRTPSWFAGAPAAAGALRLYCFPHAGGSAAAYAPWQGKLGAEVALCPIQLPGRGARFGEPAFTSMALLADALSIAIAQHAQQQPFAFFGHSMGALLMLETARRLRSAGGVQPGLLVASGCNAPARRAPSRGLHRMDDAALLAELRDYNGTPPELLEHTELMALMLPIIRADFTVVETYETAPAPPLAMKIVAFAGRDDSTAQPEDMEAWRDETVGGFALHCFDGGHFFLQSAQEAVLRQLRAELM